MAEAGLSQAEAARAAGVPPKRVHEYARRFGIEFKRRDRQKLERECQILAARCRGVTIDEIARQHGVDRERIRQILRRNGVGPSRYEKALSQRASSVSLSDQ